MGIDTFRNLAGNAEILTRFAEQNPFSEETRMILSVFEQCEKIQGFIRKDYEELKGADQAEEDRFQEDRHTGRPKRNYNDPVRVAERKRRETAQRNISMDKKALEGKENQLAGMVGKFYPSKK